MFWIADGTQENYDVINMLEPETTHDHRSCKVRGCPIVLPEDTFVEWGTRDFLMASCSDPTTIPQHEHFPLQVSLPVSGSWMHTLGPKRSMVVNPGQALFIPSGETHGTRWVERGELITITAELDWCEENCDVAASAWRNARLETVCGQAIQGILFRAAKLLREPEQDELYIGSIGITASLWVFRGVGLQGRRSATSNSAGPVRRVLRWVDEHLEEKINLASLASVANCSSWHLIRLFDSFVGTSPAKYVTERRLQEARELLSTPGSDIADVAFRCGFSSQSHFTRLFVRKFGMPPGVYRSKRGFRASLSW